MQPKSALIARNWTEGSCLLVEIEVKEGENEGQS